MLKLILGGVAGNLAGTIGLVMLGNEFPSPGDEIIASAAVAGFFVGTIGGSALGVCLAGNTRYWRGTAGSALLGSTLGLLSAFLVSAILPYTFQNLGVVYFSFLPPLGAAVLFNSTLGRRFTRSQGALFSFSRGSVKMGVPDLDVRPLFIPGIDAGPEPQFKVKILSVEL